MSRADEHGTGFTVEIAAEEDGGGRVPDLSPREAVARWTSKLRASKAESTVSTYSYQLKLFVRFCEDQGIEIIRDLTGWDIETFETERRQHATILTVNKEMITLQNFLKYAERIEIVEEGIAEKVVPPDVPKQDRIDDTLLHEDRARALLEHYRERHYGSRAHALLSILWFVGCRSGGIRGLDLDHYNSDEQWIEFHDRPQQDLPLKNGQDGERVVGLPDHVCAVLDYYIREDRYDVYDDLGRRPLLTSQVGRPGKNTIRAWTYLATLPCNYRTCPHGKEPQTCDFVGYNHASKCPSSRSPHQVRTGAITWMLNRGIPIEVVSKRVNTSVRILETHYDKPDKFEEMEKRRREHVSSLNFDNSGGENA